MAAGEGDEGDEGDEGPMTGALPASKCSASQAVLSRNGVVDVVVDVAVVVVVLSPSCDSMRMY